MRTMNTGATNRIIGNAYKISAAENTSIGIRLSCQSNVRFRKNGPDSLFNSINPAPSIELIFSKGRERELYQQRL